jgi:hypothetical protein
LADGSTDAIGKAIAGRVAPASSCMTTTQPGRTSSPPRSARRLLAWRSARPVAALLTIPFGGRAARRPSSPLMLCAPPAPSPSARERLRAAPDPGPCKHLAASGNASVLPRRATREGHADVRSSAPPGRCSGLGGRRNSAAARPTGKRFLGGTGRCCSACGRGSRGGDATTASALTGSGSSARRVAGQPHSSTLALTQHGRARCHKRTQDRGSEQYELPMNARRL